MNRHSHVTTVVRRVVAETPRIRRFELSCPDFWELPPFSAGAHVDVLLPGGETRQYSLCGDPADRCRYQIAVLREETGRGGSLALHRELGPGSVLPVSPPRNLFPLSPAASRHLFVAGGVGVTPFIAMIAELERRGGRYELHYSARSADELAFAGLLRPRVQHGTVRLYESGRSPLRLTELLRERREGEHAYCCGPARMLQGFAEATHHWPPGTVHQERFGRPETAGTPPYTVCLARSGRTVAVAANQTLAAALMAAGAPVKVACEAGVCGTCKVRYLAGTPTHGDLILTPDERLAELTTCVSGGSAGLVLDL